MPNSWNARCLQNGADLDRIFTGAGGLLGLEFTQCRDRLWRHPFVEPLAIEVREGSTPRGYLFLELYRFGFFRTGLVSTSRSPILLAPDEYRSRVIQTAVTFLAGHKGVRKIKLCLSISDQRTLEVLRGRLPGGKRLELPPAASRTPSWTCRTTSRTSSTGSVIRPGEISATT